jgi:hypothetical protein
VVGLEALTCVLLVWPRLRYYGWVATGALGAAFATIHVASAILGDVKPCRCFAVELSHNALWSHLGMTALSAGLVVMAFVGVRQRRRASPVVEGDAPCRSAR